MTWHVDIALGDDWAWSIDQADPDADPLDDQVSVVSLDTAWAMPSGGLWPLQPDLMLCTVVLNVPFFGDVGDVPSDARVSVEVKADAAGDVIARFYGDLDTLRADPRPDRPGITLTIIGVDYTGRVNELEIAEDLFVGTSTDTAAALGNIWFFKLPGGEALTGITYTNDAVDAFPATSSAVRALIDQLLIQACDHTAQTRMIWSPLVDSDGALAARSGHTRLYTLDTVKRGVTIAGDGYDAVVFPASAIGRGVGWAAARANNPGVIRITGWLNDPGNVILLHIASGDPNTAAYLNVTLDAAGVPGDGLGEIADFYGLPWSRWQNESVTIYASDAEIGEQVPVGLFPDWTLPENDDGRAMCYGRAVTITDLDVTQTPDGTTTTAGALTGARCYITAGHLYLDLSLRTLVAAEIVPGSLHLAAYGGASIGGLSPA